MADFTYINSIINNEYLDKVLDEPFYDKDTNKLFSYI